MLRSVLASRDGEGTTPSPDEVTEDMSSVPGHRGRGDEHLLYFLGALDQVLSAKLLGSGDTPQNSRIVQMSRLLLGV